MSKAVWFTVHQSALQQAFNRVIGAVESKKDIPILSHVFFEVTGETLLMRGTNLDLQIDAECETLSVQEESRFALPSDRLKGIMSNLPENVEVSFGPGRASDQVMVYFGAAKMSVSFLPADDFPLLPEVEGEWTEINGASLAQALAKVQHAIDKSDSSRIYLTGFCLHRPDNGDGIVVAGTDGKNLARIATASGGCPDFPEPPSPDSFPHIILPVKSAEIIRKLTEGANRDCRVRCGRSRISVAHAGVTVTSKLIDGMYPAYWRVIPEAGEHRLNLKLEALSASIRRINVMIDDAGFDAMLLKAGGGVIDLDMVGIRGSFAHDQLHAVTEVPAGFEIGLNGGQLQKMLSSITGSEIDIYVGDDKYPILVKPVGASNETYVLTPMRPRLTPEAGE